MVASFRINFKSSAEKQPIAAYRQVTDTELADWLSLVLIRRHDVAAVNAWYTFRTNQNMRLRHLEPGIGELYRRHAYEVELESTSQSCRE